MFKPSRGKKLLVGVVHSLATPGAPRFAGDRNALLRRGLDDARALVDGGCDALIVENFGDVPFFARSVPPETIASLALTLAAVIAIAAEVPVGINVLRNDARAALGLCAATGAQFVRINVHIGAAVTDQGVIEGRAAETLRERARLCAGVGLWCDVHVKHATPLGSESTTDAALDTLKRGLADILILSGIATGSAPDAREVANVRKAVGAAPLLIGSGLGLKNARSLLAHADGAIVGTALKHGGRVEEPVELARVTKLRRLFDALGKS